MSLEPGARLGPYQVVTLLGAGGMGEVYRATDTRLKRQVALKVLPPSVAADSERLARFQREAEVLAALNHPNIAAIYGVEDSGVAPALVMELVEGETLADRIARGLIPIDEALPIAKQIAEALEAAHEHGIIHRDLKPANVKVKDDGTLKVLDFGLAKALDPTSGAAAAPVLANSPTITSPALMTGVGVLLGTAAYMSPEQVKGRPADKRSDIWAFGCVLYEMLSGRRAFDGEDVAEVLAAVLTKEPDWAALTTAPLPVLPLLRRCLHKSPRERLHDMADARLELNEAEGNPDHRAAANPPNMRMFAAAIVMGALSVGGLLFVSFWPNRSAPQQNRVMFNVSPPDGFNLGVNGSEPRVAISPDGFVAAIVLRRLGAAGTVDHLGLRDLANVDVRMLPGAENARNPFFSPDGEWIGFFANNELKKISRGGGQAVRLAPAVGGPRGASWGDDGTIVFATSDLATGLSAVRASGSDVRHLTTPDAANGDDHTFPLVLPGSRHVLFTAGAGDGLVSEASRIMALDLANGDIRVLLTDAAYPRLAGEDWLVYLSRGVLNVVKLDLTSATLRTEPFTAASVTATPFFDVSRSGTLVSTTGARDSESGLRRTLVWVDRQGREEATGSPPRAYAVRRVQLSPDGSKVVTEIGDPLSIGAANGADLWIWDLARRSLTRLTNEPGDEWHGVWSRDAKRVFVASGPTGNHSLAVVRADGSGGFTRLAPVALDQMPQALTPDGRFLIFRQQDGPTGKGDLYVAPVDGSSAAVRLFQTPFIERNASLSPDGRWLAYDSDQSGQFEVYVRPFPNVEDGLWQISTDGGSGPIWSRTGNELFYLTAQLMMTVAKTNTHGSFEASLPESLFDASTYYRVPSGPGGAYDIAPDGRRFLMVKSLDDPADQARTLVTLNWLSSILPSRGE